ncbi:amidohydrolase [Erythrobacter sp. HKB08]|uniref:amidohydrolase family protein n=1 Tax=Erythrobacter sp. HKB08 TaxID=2502843 RepID=UPI0010087832|nr:amidohydrolase family protein [Erythrobacter sp. HKB08]
MSEEILEPELPIIDPHHHLWDLRPLLPAFPDPRHPFIDAIAGAAHYTFDQLLADLTTGHNIVGTVFMECGAFYRADADERMKPVGEVEFVNGVAAQSASGLYGDVRACAGIVGHADLLAGEHAGAVLDALDAAGNGRFRGIRHQGAWDKDGEVLGAPFHAPEGLYAEKRFREGLAEVGKRGMTFDAWVIEPQLDDVIDLAKAFPDQPIMLDHCGTPLNIASYSGKLHERFDTWRTKIHALAECENVSVKLGGLAMAFCGLPEDGPAKGLGSETLAAMWRPYIETCIEAFGTKRGLFESNYPVDRWGATYPVLWNAFKRITHGYTAEEKRDLYAGNAARFYKLEGLPGLAD